MIESSTQEDRVMITPRLRHFPYIYVFFEFRYLWNSGCLIVFLNLFIPDNQQLPDQLRTSYNFTGNHGFCVHAKGFP